MNITTNLQVSTRKPIATTRIDARAHEEAPSATKSIAVPPSEAQTTSTVPTWKRAIVRYQRRKAKRLAARAQATLVLEAEAPAKVPSWKQAIIRYQRRKAKRLAAQ